MVKIQWKKKDVLRLLERDKPGGVGGSDTRTTVLDWLVGDWELAQIVSNHLGLKENMQKTLTIAGDQYDFNV